ncbi:MAG: hypothetical protein KDE51_20605 [Anaerolineales bacterium]|nr:hypothetical protein [Anaerolineales bacterium]
MSVYTLNKIICGLLIGLGVMIFTGALPTNVVYPEAAGANISGLGIACIYLEGLFTGRITISTHNRRYYPRTYGGVSARLLGAANLLLGITISTAGVVEWLHPQWLLNWLLTPFGLACAILLGSSWLIMQSVIVIYGSVEAQAAGWLALRHLPDRVFGTIMLAVAAMTLGVGLVQLVSPDTAATLWATLGIQLLATP